MLYRGSKYYTDSEGLRQTLDTFGVAIIPNLFSPKECKKILSDMWDYFEYITQKWDVPIDRNDNNTWKEIYKLYPLHSMLIQYFGIGQAQFAWNVRENPKIIEVYENLFDTTELLVSFDGSSFSVPPEITKRGWFRSAKFHTDQSYCRNEFECAQSWITALDVEEGDATLAVLEGSNLFHAEFARVFSKNNKADWYKLNDSEIKWYINKGCREIRIKCPKGSAVFWDSRTIHCGVEPEKNRLNPKIRAIVYTCYMPREYITNANLKKKIKAFNDLRTTNHWPVYPKLFPKHPRTYGGPEVIITPYPKPTLTERGLKLAGF